MTVSALVAAIGCVLAERERGGGEGGGEGEEGRKGEGKGDREGEGIIYRGTQSIVGLA